VLVLLFDSFDTNGQNLLFKGSIFLVVLALISILGAIRTREKAKRIWMILRGLMLGCWNGWFIIMYLGFQPISDLNNLFYIVYILLLDTYIALEIVYQVSNFRIKRRNSTKVNREEATA